MRERSEIVVLTIVETCEARVGTFIYQERTVEVSAGLFNGQETSYSDTCGEKFPDPAHQMTSWKNIGGI